MRIPLTLTSIVLALTALPGCGGAVSLVLKPPVESTCEEAGLAGCSDLTEGILAYASGDQGRGLTLVQKGAAENSPDELRTFADGLAKIGELPGVAQYMGPVLEVAKVLRSSPGKPSEGPSSSANAKQTAGGARVSGTLGATPAAGTVRVAHQVFPVTEKERFACVINGKAGSCVRLSTGPLTLTNASASPDCAGDAAIFAASFRYDQSGLQLTLDQRDAAWTAYPPLQGASWPVPKGRALIAGVVAETPEKQSARAGCAISWSGEADGHVDDRL